MLNFNRPAYPADIKPGYLPPLLPDHAPEEPETFEAIMEDVNKIVIPGVTNWHSPKYFLKFKFFKFYKNELNFSFFAYFPTANSYPAIVADILCDAIGCIGFTWASSPSCTELETVMMDWLAKMLNLPDHFLFESNGKGGGIIHGTASEATLTALLSAKANILEKYRAKNPDSTPGSVIDRLVAFSSDQAHCSVERAGLLGGITNFVKVQSDNESNAVRGETLKAALEEAKSKGLIPFYVVATLGATSMCSFDNLMEMGKVISDFNKDSEYPVWLHIDAAYAGSSFICPEFRPWLNGVEYADSFNFNPHKWMLVNFDCSTMWFKDASLVVNAFNVDPVYLKHQFQGGSVPDYRHWQIPLGRRFRSLKLFFVLRLYGVKGIQEHIRNQVRQAHLFESFVKADKRFEIVGQVHLGLVCFRLITGDDLESQNKINETLFKAIGEDNRIHLVPTKVK